MNSSPESSYFSASRRSRSTAAGGGGGAKDTSWSFPIMAEVKEKGQDSMLFDQGQQEEQQKRQEYYITTDDDDRKKYSHDYNHGSDHKVVVGGGYSTTTTNVSTHTTTSGRLNDNDDDENVINQTTTFSSTGSNSIIKDEDDSFPFRFDYLSSVDPLLGEKIQGSATSLYEMMKNMDRVRQLLDNVPDGSSDSDDTSAYGGGEDGKEQEMNTTTTTTASASHRHIVGVGDAADEHHHHHHHHHAVLVEASSLSTKLSSSLQGGESNQKGRRWGQDSNLDELISNRNLDLVTNKDNVVVGTTDLLLLERDNLLKRLWQRLLQFVFFIQGPLTGLSLAIFYDISLLSSRRGHDNATISPTTSFMTDIGIQRLCIILNVICLSGVIIQVPLQNLVPPICHHLFLSSRFSNNSSGPTILTKTNKQQQEGGPNTSSNNRPPPNNVPLHRIIILFLYFLSTILTMLMARIVMIHHDDDDKQDGTTTLLSNSATSGAAGDDLESNTINKQTIFERQLVALSTCRAICCLFAWAMEMYSSFSSLPPPLLSSSVSHARSTSSNTDEKE